MSPRHDFHRLSVRELLARRADASVSAAELTEHFLGRIGDHDGALNSLISVCEERAREQAAAVDKQGSGTLAGLPILHKDIFCTQGVRTSCGSRMLDNFVAPYDADAVERLDRAGTVTLGKANMDEF
ncbi:amidase family protein, partial [Salinisphaera aquimarina]